MIWYMTHLLTRKDKKMKHLFLILPFLAAACANNVEVTRETEYKCGEKIVQADFLDDDSMILRVDGINNVLVKVAATSGKRFENSASKVTFMQQNGDYYLSISGHNYPVCQEISR